MNFVLDLLDTAVCRNSFWLKFIQSKTFQWLIFDLSYQILSPDTWEYWSGKTSDSTHNTQVYQDFQRDEGISLGSIHSSSVLKLLNPNLCFYDPPSCVDLINWFEMFFHWGDKCRVGFLIFIVFCLCFNTKIVSKKHCLQSI